MPGLHSSEVDSAVRVVVTPSQSSYFAGEPFSVTITLTNTRSPESGPSRPHSHKRGAHSISSAPLARPPTSPGTPRTAIPNFLTQPRNGEDPHVRKGLIGRPEGTPKVTDELPNLIEQRRKRLLNKSLSVSIAPHELEAQLGEAKSASYAHSTFNADSRFRTSLQLTPGLHLLTYTFSTHVSSHIVPVDAFGHSPFRFKPPPCSKTICPRRPTPSRIDFHAHTRTSLHAQLVYVNIFPGSRPDRRKRAFPLPFNPYTYFSNNRDTVNSHLCDGTFQ